MAEPPKHEPGPFALTERQPKPRVKPRLKPPPPRPQLAARTRPVQIEIPLLSKPRRLYGSDCLPPPAISLVPTRDSTAYIVSKLVLPPPLPAHYDRKRYMEAPGIRRMLYYTIGWTDMPAARVAVLATQVLDYVSPRVLEDFEYGEFLAAEEERERAAAEMTAAEMAAARGQGHGPRGGGGGGGEKKPKGKRGRPRKGPAAAAAQEVVRLVEEEDDREKELPATQEEVLRADKIAAEPSLSTPSKRRRGLAQLLEMEDTEAETGSEHAAMVRRVDGSGGDEEMYGPNEVADAQEMDMDSDVPATRPSVSTSVSVSASGGGLGSSRASSLALIPEPVTLSRPSPVIVAKQKPSPVETPVPIPQPGLGRGPTAQPTPQPIPSADYYAQANEQHRKRKADGPSTIATPRSKPAKGAPTKAPTQSHTQPSIAGPNGTAAPAAPQARVEQPQRQISGFTPVHVHVRTPSTARKAPSALPVVQNIPPVPPAPATTGDPSSLPAKRKRSGKRKTPQPGSGADEAAWEVVRLEGDRRDYDAHGNLARYFRVRWKGDWPADQNPTWEPEDNISPELVAKYLRERDRADRHGGSSDAHSPAQKRRKKERDRDRDRGLMPKKRYSNVAEAFEGEVGELGDLNPPLSTGLDGHGWGDGEDDDDDGEERFVVSEDHDVPGFSMFDRKLSTYRQTFGGAS